MNTAYEIYRQIGQVLAVRLGVRDRLATESGTIFKMTAGQTVYVEIKLNANDLYDMEVFKIYKLSRKVRHSYTDLATEQMTDILNRFDRGLLEA